jgi:hypothetical protein
MNSFIEVRQSSNNSTHFVTYLRKKAEEMTKTVVGTQLVLHQVNATVHMACAVCKFLVQNETPVLSELPCGPFLSTGNLLLFSKMEVGLKGH